MICVVTSEFINPMLGPPFVAGIEVADLSALAALFRFDYRYSR